MLIESIAFLAEQEIRVPKSFTALLLVSLLPCIACSGGDAGNGGDASSADATTSIDASAPSLDIPGFTAGSFKQVAVGEVHVCALSTEDLVLCWGANYAGQSDVPGDLGRVVKITAAVEHSCALTAEGQVRCWGRPHSGEVDVPSDLPTAVDLATTVGRTCAMVEDGTLWCWGAGSLTQRPLAVGSRVTIAPAELCVLDGNGSIDCEGPDDPAFAPGANAEVAVQMSAGIFQSCAVTAEGAVRCWSSNRNARYVYPPPTDLGRATEVHVSTLHACMRSDAGTVECWGANPAGQTSVPPAVQGALGLAVGEALSCAIMPEGIQCWGQAMVERGDTGKSSMVVAGRSNTCALDLEGKLGCWGANDRGQSRPPEELGVTRHFDVLSHGCAVSSTGEVRCWGMNDLGQADVPPSLPPARAVAVSDVNSCSLGIDQKVTCWGDETGAKGAPVESDVQMLKAGYMGHCALLGDGHVQCWNRFGQVSAPTTPGPYVDVDAAVLRDACAVHADGRLVCWEPGGNEWEPTTSGHAVEYGGSPFGLECVRIDDGSIRCHDEEVMTSAPAQALSVGLMHSCILTVAGDVSCWGRNHAGQAMP